MTEDEKAANEWANGRCILRSGDRQQVCYEGFLAGVEYGRKELNDVIAARQKDADMAAHYYKKCQELQAFIDELVLKGVVK